ncbi:MAG: Zn-dependent hydrolase [Rickettsiales bacterium]|nr:Zn-dependent hydrolase [Rickettsiales bacterium]
MIFRQLFDRESCTYTYLLADPCSKEALLIDPVLEQVARDLEIIAELGLKLRFTLETHVHADHITGADRLRAATGSKSALSPRGGADCADLYLDHGDCIEFGEQVLEVIATPGHTSTCLSYYLRSQDMVFTGDTLFIRGCGRTDFQQGSIGELYRSVNERLFTLPDETRVYPGHDYAGRTLSTIGEEKAHNPRLGGGRSLAEFTAIMEGLALSDPKKIAVSLPANRNCGRLDAGDVAGPAQS